MTLKAAGASSGCQVGTAAPQVLLQDDSIAQFVVRNFNLLTASGLKWDAVHPQPDSHNFTEADWNINFAEKNGMRVHGHNLCWNSPANPPWFKSVLNQANARQFLTSHITTVMRRYQGRVDSWDVVNEPVVSWSRRSDGLYPGAWLDLLGPEYIDIAFHAAALADPKPLRILNIYDVEQGTPEDELTRTRTITLLKQLVARGVPIQAVGLESHLDVSQPLGKASFLEFIKEIRALAPRSTHYGTRRIGVARDRQFNGLGSDRSKILWGLHRPNAVCCSSAVCDFLVHPGWMVSWKAHPGSDLGPSQA